MIRSPMMTARLSSITALGALMIVVGACERQPPALVQLPPGEAPVIDLAAPENAAKTALLSLQAELRAVANEDEETSRTAFDQLRYLIDDESVFEMLNRTPRYKALLGEDLIKGLIENWGSAIAYYAEGLHLDQMRRLSESASKVLVVVPASGAHDDALIQVTCVFSDDDSWHVSRIEFVRPDDVIEPAAPAGSQPTSTP